MGFMAGFWGSMASAHQETTQNWKQLFQVDKQLKLQEEKQRQEDLRAQAAHDLDLKKLEESTRQFDVNAEIARLRLALEQDEFDLDYARNYFEDFSPRLEGLPFLQQVDALAALENDLAGNKFAAPHLTGIRNTINTQTMSEAQALSVLNGYYNPAMDEHGRPQRTPYFLVETALGTLDDMGSTYATEAREEVENVRKSIDEQYEYESNLFQEIKEAELDRERAAAEQARASAGHQIALTGNVEEDTRQMTDMFDTNLEHRRAEIENLNLTNANLEMRNEVTADILEAELRTLIAAADRSEMENEVYDQTREYMVRQIAAQTGVSEAEARVAGATVEFRIQGAKISVDEARANINLMEAQAEHTSVDSERIRDAIDKGRIEIASNIILSNRTDLWDAFGQELLEPILGDNWEAVSEIVRESIEGYEAEDAAMREAEFLFKTAQTAKTESDTRLNDIMTELYPAEAETRRIQANASMTGAQAQARNAAVNEAAQALRNQELQRKWALEDAPVPHNTAIAAAFEGVAGGVESFGIDRINQMVTDIDMIEAMLADGTVTSEGAMVNLAPVLERMGIGVSEFSAANPAAIAGLLEGIKAEVARETDRFAQRLAIVASTAEQFTGSHVDARDVAQAAGLVVGGGNSLVDGLIEQANQRSARATHVRDVQSLGANVMFSFANEAIAEGAGIGWVVGQDTYQGLYNVLENRVSQELFGGNLAQARDFLEDAGGPAGFKEIYEHQTAELEQLVASIDQNAARTGVGNLVDYRTYESTAQSLNDVMYLRDEALNNAADLEWMAQLAQRSSDYMTADPTSDTAVQHYNVIDQMSQLLGMSVEDMVNNGLLYQTSFRGMDGQNHPVYHPTAHIADAFQTRARELDPLVDQLLELTTGVGRADTSNLGLNLFGAE